MLEHESGVLPSMAAIDESIHVGMQPVHQVRTYNTGEGGGGVRWIQLEISTTV